MYYLKCNHCGNYCEVKNEYLIFCPRCNKKLENNFFQWKSKDEERTFDDFKRIACISCEQLPQESDVELPTEAQNQNRWIGTTLIVLFVITLIISIIEFFIIDFQTHFRLAP